MSSTSERSDYLDGLRGFAILGVVLIHVGQLYSQAVPAVLANFTNYGFRGVQLFFMVSALTLTASLRRRPADLGSYALRRFLRIAPMFYLAAVFYLILGGTGPSRFAPDGISPLDISLTFLMLHGFSLTSINSVVPGGWSVASEVIFYALLPLTLMFATSLRRSLLLLAIGVMAAILFPPVVHAIFGQVPHRELVDDFAEFGFFAERSGIPSWHRRLLGAGDARLAPAAWLRRTDADGLEPRGADRRRVRGYRVAANEPRGRFPAFRLGHWRRRFQPTRS